MSRRGSLELGLVILALGTLAPATRAGYTYTTIDVPGVANSYATAISNQGSIVGLSVPAPLVDNGYIRSADGTTLTSFVIGNASGVTRAQGVNNSGVVSGFYNLSNGSNGNHGFLRAADGTVTTYDAPGSLASGATFFSGINNAGTVVGYETTTLVGVQVIQGFVRNAAGSYTFLSDPASTPFHRTYALGINQTGDVAGYYSSGSGNHGFYLTAASIASGTPVFHNFDVPGAANGSTTAEAINSLGQVVGYYTDSVGTTHGFLFDTTSNSYTTFDAPGAQNITYLFGINDTGQLVGGYYDSAGVVHGFLATPTAVPEPTAAALALTGLGLVLAGRAAVRSSGRRARASQSA